MIEVFVPINGYETLYEISNTGKVKSLAKFKGTRYTQYIPERIMKPRPNTYGYLQVGLCLRNVKKPVYVHRLVASHFINNPENKKEVNHIDGDKHNNKVENLEWCTRMENEKHSYSIGLKRKGSMWGNSKKVVQMDLSGSVLKEWSCIKEVSEHLGVDRRNIVNCCKGLKSEFNGYKWSYAA